MKNQEKITIKAQTKYRKISEVKTYLFDISNKITESYFSFTWKDYYEKGGITTNSIEINIIILNIMFM